MAENKKSFVLYSDLIHSIENLSDAEAGILFKHVLRYVNDKNPVCPDRITQIAFEPIKQQLKRDLVKFESKKKQWAEAGKKSAEAKKLNKNNLTPSTESTDVNERSIRSTESTVSVNDNVNDNVNVNVSVNDNVILKNQKKAWTDDHFLKLIILERYPTVSKLKEPTPKQLDGLLEKYTKNEIESVLGAMENYKKLLKNCTTVFLTLKNWLERRENDKSQTNGKFITNAEKSAGLDRMVEQSKEHLQRIADKYGK